MKNKRYLRLSTSSIILQIITVLFIFGNFYFCGFLILGAIKLGKDNPDLWLGILLSVLLFLGGLLFVYIETTFYVGSIRLEKDRIANYGDNRIGRDKIQFKAVVEYVDISKIEIVALRKMSNGQAKYVTRPIPYLCIINKKGNKKYFGLHFIRKTTVKQLIEDLIKKCEEFNNPLTASIDDIMKDFEKAIWAVAEE